MILHDSLTQVLEQLLHLKNVTKAFTLVIRLKEGTIQTPCFARVQISRSGSK